MLNLKNKLSADCHSSSNKIILSPLLQAIFWARIEGWGGKVLLVGIGGARGGGWAADASPDLKHVH